MKVDKEFFVKAYFPSCFNMASMGGRYDPKGIRKEGERKNFFAPFLGAAEERFRELAVRDGFWDEGIEGDGDVEMS
jgi:hypothetical protein